MWHILNDLRNQNGCREPTTDDGKNMKKAEWRSFSLYEFQGWSGEMTCIGAPLKHALLFEWWVI